MKIQIDTKAMQKELKAQLKDMSERRINAAVATALTRTVREIEKKWQANINANIKAPTKRTQKATVVRQATAKKLMAEVKLRDVGGGQMPADYLVHHETADERLVKKFERALVATGAMPPGYFVVPGRGAVLDGYGNVSRGQIVQVITQLGGKFSPGYQRVISPDIKKRRASAAKRGRVYVAVRPGAEEQAHRVSAGIYERLPNGDRVAVFLYKSSLSYRKRLSLRELAEKAALPVFRNEFGRAISDSRARMMAKG
jgi:hypothetical protein